MFHVHVDGFKDEFISNVLDNKDKVVYSSGVFPTFKEALDDAVAVQQKMEDQFSINEV